MCIWPQSASRIKREMNGTKNRLAVVLHLEGAEAIDHDLDFLHVLYAAGLRSLGPVWSRDNIFGHGVPFRFPADPDIGDGLTEAGERLVRACNDMKILVDLSHINDKGFWDVARLSTAPLMIDRSADANMQNACAVPRRRGQSHAHAVVLHELANAYASSGWICGLNGLIRSGLF